MKKFLFTLMFAVAGYASADSFHILPYDPPENFIRNEAMRDLYRQGLDAREFKIISGREVSARCGHTAVYYFAEVYTPANELFGDYAVTKQDYRNYTGKVQKNCLAGGGGDPDEDQDVPEEDPKEE